MKRKPNQLRDATGLDVVLAAVPARNPSEAYYAARQAADAAYVCVCGQPAPGRCCPDHGRPHEDRGQWLRTKESA